MLQSEDTSTIVDVPPRRVPSKLGIITGSLAYRDSQGSFAVNHSLGRLLDALRERVPGARLCMPVVPERHQYMNHLVNYPSDAIVALPPLSSTIAAQRYYLQTRRVLRDFAAECDALYIQLPFQLPICLLGLNQPTVLQVVGNPVEVIRASSDYRGAKKYLARWFAGHMFRVMRRMVAQPHTRTVTHGEEMWHKLGCRDGRAVVSSCIRKAEMRPREDLRLGEPPRLLFVGYLRPEKGVATLLDAFERVCRNREVKLTLVGGTDRNTDAGQLILQQLSKHPFRGDIQTTGIMDFGESLFDMYRSHDVYVLPSLSEGTPRTVVEARSFGCPVVATRVGGIPSSVQHGVDGLLVEPSDSVGLAAAIEQILDDDSLRRDLIHAGIRRSQAQTLEVFADSLVDELRLVVEPNLS